MGAHTGHNSAESMRENGFSGESGFTQKIHHGNVSAQIAAPAHAHGCEYSDTMGLAGKRPKEKYHSYKGEVGKVAENILDRDFSTTAPMQKWTTDVSQFGFSWGKCYLSPILDMNTNEIISYDLSQSANMEQIQRMLAGAFTKFPSVDGLIFHSDQGWQYQHVYFRQALKDHKIIQSMSRKGNCYDNCIMETFFGRMKNEMFYGHEKEYSAFEAFAKAVDGYINYYNNERIQEKTKWMPPTKFREASMCT